MIFVKLIRILAAVFAFWLILNMLYWILGKKVTAHTKRKAYHGNKRRKFVKSQIVENPDQTDDKTKS